MPKTIDDTYCRILESIPSEHLEAATRVLQFLTYSERPLTIDEVVDAIAVNIREQPHFHPKYRMPDPNEITSFCSSLVVKMPRQGSERMEDEERTYLQLAHFSVKEYLTSDRVCKSIQSHIREPVARITAAKACLAYLLHFNHEITETESLQDFPFAGYSSMFWMKNLPGSLSEEDDLMNFIERLFCDHKISYNVCFNIHRSDRRYPLDKPAPEICFAAFLNIAKIVKLLAEKGAEVNAKEIGRASCRERVF